jgi:hypothetical protein
MPAQKRDALLLHLDREDKRLVAKTALAEDRSMSSVIRQILKKHYSRTK